MKITTHKIYYFRLYTEIVNMTAEFSIETDSKSDISLIEELAKDYTRYLEVDASKQVNILSIMVFEPH